jgi:hypothetical protein
MAVTRVGGKDGAVSLPSGFNADFASWTLRCSQPVDDDTSYTDTGTGSSHAGAGTIDYNLTAAGFLKANAASTAPGLDSFSETAGAVTLTAKTGCTETGNFIMSGATLDHRKRAGAVPISYEGINKGDLTETWATS